MERFYLPPPPPAEYQQTGEECSDGFNAMFSGVSLVSLLTAVEQPPSKRPRAGMVPRGSALARQRRQRLCEKTRCLQRVLPWDKKMDMATMLAETYKYIKFLKAQLAALSAMPAFDSFDSSFGPGGLGRLSRSQLLQVLVNSPVAQTVLYSKGCCVYSVEQLGLLFPNPNPNPNPFSSF